MADRNNQNLNRIRRALDLSDQGIVEALAAAGHTLTKRYVNTWHIQKQNQEGHGSPFRIMTDSEFDLFCLGLELSHRQSDA